MRLLSLAVAATLAVASAGRADEPPRPPEGHPVVALARAATWTAPAGGGICMDMPAALYQVERVRYYEERIRQAEARAESTPWRIVLASVGVGLAAGAAVALVRR
jgi:hypothetical protein